MQITLCTIWILTVHNRSVLRKRQHNRKDVGQRKATTTIDNKKIKIKSYAENFSFQRLEPVQAKQNFKLLVLIYDILPPTTAIMGYVYNTLPPATAIMGYVYNTLPPATALMGYVYNTLPPATALMGYVYNTIHPATALMGYVYNTLPPTTAIMGYATGL